MKAFQVAIFLLIALFFINAQQTEASSLFEGLNEGSSSNSSDDYEDSLSLDSHLSYEADKMHLKLHQK